MTGGAAADRRRDHRWPIALLAVAVLAALLALASAWGRDRAAPPATETADVLVTYAREGGITGARTTLTVAASGDVTLDGYDVEGSEAGTRRLPPDQLAALRNALERSGFHDLERSYRHAGACNDCYLDTVTYRGRSVSVKGSAVPPGLAEVLRLLGEVAAGA